MREAVPPVKAGRTVVAIPDSCEKKIAGKISKGKLNLGEDPKVLTVRRGGIIDKLNARIDARDKCAGARQAAFGGAP